MGANQSPDAFVGYAQKAEPSSVLTGTAYSSHAPASWWVQPVVLPQNVVISNINVFKSFDNGGGPAATSVASSGSEGYTYSHGVSVFTRANYVNASSNSISFIASASFGMTVSMSYTSTSQLFGMSWNTDSTGGTSGVSTTSNAAGWSSLLSGPKLIPIPFVKALSQGEYFFAHNHSSTTATSNSNVTLMSISNLHVAPQLVTYGALGAGSTTLAASGDGGGGIGIASAVTTTALMPLSVVSAATVNNWVQIFSNV